MANDTAAVEAGRDFIRDIIDADKAAGRVAQVVTRFPPEPNGYLHIGHAKAIWIDFSAAAAHGGTCNLRFDDTNPEVEDVEYVEQIKADMKWLGFEYANEYYASDYFPKLYDFAEQMIKEGKAYVDSRSLDELRESRGDFHKP